MRRPATLPRPAKVAQNGRAELLAIVIRARQGDFEAHSELVRRFTNRVGAFVRPLVSPSHVVEDAVQVTFIKISRRIGSLRDPRMFESWLLTLARNTALDFVRRAQTRPVTVPEAEAGLETPDADSSTIVREIMDALEFALQKLSKTDARIVRHIVQGDNYHTVARRTGLSTEAVRNRLHRARVYLRACLGQNVRALPATPPAISEPRVGKLAA